MTKDEALKLALEALEEIALAGMSGSGQESDEGMKAWHARRAWEFIGIAARQLTAIKKALAQPAQEPVAWMMKWAQHSPSFTTDKSDYVSWFAGKASYPDELVPLYTTPQQRPWVGLTDEEASWCQAPSTIQTWKRIEAKLKEKNFD